MNKKTIEFIKQVKRDFPEEFEEVQKEDLRESIFLDGLQIELKYRDGKKIFTLRKIISLESVKTHKLALKEIVTEEFKWLFSDFVSQIFKK
jgi:hypothetical protein